MDKTKQRELLSWLKQQSTLVRRYLRLLMLLGIVTSLLIALQAWLMATLLQGTIIEQIPRDKMGHLFIWLILTVLAKAVITWIREQIGFRCGMQVRQIIRKQLLERLQHSGPAWIKGKPAGSWSTLLVEQIEQMHDYYARYLPQITLATMIPLVIVLTLLPVNWVAALILFFTAPLIPFFMMLVGLGAAEASRRNFTALSRLSGYFLDRLHGLYTLRLFNRGKAELEMMQQAADDLRNRTMDVLKLAFLSSAVLEFFASVSIAIVAVYFGFSYLGQWHFGSYGVPITLGAGFLALILAPEFFQPLRDLGSFYHAKAQAIGAAEALIDFLHGDGPKAGEGTVELDRTRPIEIQARDLIILSADGHKLAGPLSFHIAAGEKIAIVGCSGAGKSSLLNVLMGFLPYQGSLTFNEVELNTLSAESLHSLLGWIGQNPHLPEQTLRQNIILGRPDANEDEINMAIEQAHVAEFLPSLNDGLETVIGDNAARLSVGQAQRIAVARALLHPCQLLLLDEPAASLDANSERFVMQALTQLSRLQTTILVTHQLQETRHFDQIWVMEQGLLVQTGKYEAMSQQKESPFARLLSYRQQEC